MNLDREQFKRVVVNLVDNAAESMRDSMVKRLLVATRAVSADVAELLVADTGRGISAEATKRNCSFRTSLLRVAAPVWDWRL